MNRVGELAEEQKHHPDVDFGRGRAGLTLFTHNIYGLTESAFAAKIVKL